MCHIIMDLIYKFESVCVCVCVSGIRARVSCPIAVKLDVVAGRGGGGGGSGGAEGQVIAGLTSPFLRFAESYQCISAMSFADQRPFQNIVHVDFRFLPDLIGCRPIRISTDNHHSS